jgi:hypothetical protein
MGCLFDLLFSKSIVRKYSCSNLQAMIFINSLHDLHYLPRYNYQVYCCEVIVLIHIDTFYNVLNGFSSSKGERTNDSKCYIILETSYIIRTFGMPDIPYF